jgi:3-dehydroquinate dehydratase-2
LILINRPDASPPASRAGRYKRMETARQDADAITINPAGFSFTSVAIMDAIKALEGPVLEVHISNIHARDEYRRHSKISFAATGVICGLGP